MKKTKSLKAIVLSLGLAALMAPATMNAQINRGLLENPYKDNSNKNHGMMNPPVALTARGSKCSSRTLDKMRPLHHWVAASPS